MYQTWTLALVLAAGGTGGTGGGGHYEDIGAGDMAERYGDDSNHHEFGDIDIGDTQTGMSADDIQALVNALIDGITKDIANNTISIMMDGQKIAQQLNKTKVSKIGVWQQT